jgi:hypothetical protein
MARFMKSGEQTVKFPVEHIVHKGLN